MRGCRFRDLGEIDVEDRFAGFPRLVRTWLSIWSWSGTTDYPNSSTCIRWRIEISAGGRIGRSFRLAFARRNFCGVLGRFLGRFLFRYCRLCGIFAFDLYDRRGRSDGLERILFGVFFNDWLRFLNFELCYVRVSGRTGSRASG